ncbi:MAG: hypothetical protein M0Q92_00920 [Methanoregula sp.]|jgi:ABC-type multidrug transport system permease subunit|nr:hypothetical protein [Methanoregula sp.]
MDVTSVKRAGFLILGLICAYFLANTVSVAFLSTLRLSGAVMSVGGFLIFAIIFLLILRGLEKISGMVFFAFDLK